MTRDEERYFSDVNEAVTEELVKRFDKLYFSSIPALQEEWQRREEFKMQNDVPDDIVTVTTQQQIDGKWETFIYPYGYEKECKKLWSLIREIYEQNKGDFSSQEEVFTLFAKAAFSGRILDVARLVEKTFGKGSFRKLGERTKK